MKSQIILTHIHKAYTRPQIAAITRGRAAYLLRAARSRRLDKIDRKPDGYFIRDCSIKLSRIA